MIVADIYSTALWDKNAAALVSPPPRESETRERFAGTEMRVSWWRPGWGDRHPGIMIANGATAFGNDDPETRRLAEALARGGYLVMLPEFPFLKEVRFERGATEEMDAAFALLRTSTETQDRTVGAFGSSVGAGILLAAAGGGTALARADYLTVLGTYFDMDTYLASVASDTQLRAARLEPWTPDPIVGEKLPKAALEAMDTDADRAALRAALAAGPYDAVLARLRAGRGAERRTSRAHGVAPDLARRADRRRGGGTRRRLLVRRAPHPGRLRVVGDASGAVKGRAHLQSSTSNRGSTRIGRRTQKANTACGAGRPT